MGDDPATDRAACDGAPAQVEPPAQRLEPPADIDLPFFAYGVFKPGELAFFQLRDLVTRVAEADLPGGLRLRDGLPILVAGEPGSVGGALLEFAPDDRPKAYDRISAMEPRSQYRWVDERSIDGRHANVLVGRHPAHSSDHLEGEWSSWDDPWFTEALDVVEETMNMPREGSWYAPLFRLQMAYMLLWSSIEHYISLRYCLGSRAAVQIDHLSSEDAFGSALRLHVTRTDKVHRVDHPTQKANLVAASPADSLQYYYQLRSNITHRGKRTLSESDRLSRALRELLTVFRDVLAAAEEDAKRLA